jgi:MoxR-like ATPase
MAKTSPVPEVKQVVDIETILKARQFVDRIAIDDRLREYIVSLVFATREPARAGLSEIEHHIQYGGSPRATIWLALCARAHAFISGRGYVTPADIKGVAPEVLRHRVVPTYEAEAEGLDSDALVARVLETVPVP